MQLSQFIQLSEKEKQSVVFSEGVALAQRDVENNKIFLFQLPHYYVEIYCCKETKRVLQFIMFHDPEHLTPYLDAIPLDGLLTD